METTIMIPETTGKLKTGTHQQTGQLLNCLVMTLLLEFQNSPS